MSDYHIIYRDARGEEISKIKNSGKTLSVLLRGVRFSGEDFDSLSPLNGSTGYFLKEFDLHQECLCCCRFVITIPTIIIEGGSEFVLDLVATIELGRPSPKGGLESESVSISLFHPKGEIRSLGSSGWFEDELLDIKRGLPEGSSLKSCIGCAYSDYSPFGHGLFGDMLCFRNLKEEYSMVKSKDDLWPLHDRFDRFVQETYLCDEFEVRPPNTGYRR